MRDNRGATTLRCSVVVQESSAGRLQSATCQQHGRLTAPAAARSSLERQFVSSSAERVRKDGRMTWDRCETWGEQGVREIQQVAATLDKGGSCDEEGVGIEIVRKAR
jgi:hypothetical protein